jgi:hypothetical protein
MDESDNILIAYSAIVFFIFVSFFISLFLFFRGSKKQRISYFVSGLIVSSLNTIIEALSYKYSLYEIKGPWKILATPFPMFILWIFLSFIYIDLYFRIKNKFPTFLYLILGVVLGWCFDFIGWKVGVLEIKENGSPFVNASIWVVLVPLSLVIPKLILKGK